ncbi:uncharacterized protein J4E79_008599 [Alternaria viburni]|uniref:uncharacterized protein n=1 Tax=Alternaria viburni TaxID=566460 RepID=UPI0020C34835|nr:uncharacterized protein J4E79_008599 [Alternaria viburni]KAI4653086.1 hypothetical protein J4E79_008599 [Alternaria viburni]
MTPQQNKKQKKPKPSAAVLETRLQTAYTSFTARAPVTLKPTEVPIDINPLAEWMTLLNTPTEFGLPLSSWRTQQTRTKFDTAMNLTNRGVAYLENVMPALVKANMAMKERLRLPPSESMITDSSPPPLGQYAADDGPPLCTSSLRFNDCSGTADDFASVPDRTTSETAMTDAPPLSPEEAVCEQNAGGPGPFGEYEDYTTMQLLTVNSDLMTQPHDEQYLPSPEDWMCTPDEDLAYAVMDEQANDDTPFQRITEASESVMHEQADNTTPQQITEASESVMHEQVDNTTPQQITEASDSVMHEQADNTTPQQITEAPEQDLAPRPPRPRMVMPNKPTLKPRQLGETDLPVVLRIPRSDANSRHGDVNYNSISEDTTSAITNAMTNVLLDSQGTRRLQWATVSRNPGTWSAHPCVSNAVAAKGARNSTWKQAGDDRTLACDTCIKKHRPCIRLEQLQGEEDYSVIWCALPDELREGSKPDDIAFWMRVK